MLTQQTPPSKTNRGPAAGPGNRRALIAAARAVYAAFDAALARGAAVLLIASDLDEIVARCDRLAALVAGSDLR